MIARPHTRYPSGYPMFASFSGFLDCSGAAPNPKCLSGNNQFNRRLTLPYGQCHIVFPHAHICINSGADALVPAQRAPRPPGRPVELWKDLILREKSGTGASRGPDIGVKVSRIDPNILETQ